MSKRSRSLLTPVAAFSVTPAARQAAFQVDQGMARIAVGVAP
jgi:hypothetical protein